VRARARARVRARHHGRQAGSRTQAGRTQVSAGRCRVKWQTPSPAGRCSKTQAVQQNSAETWVTQAAPQRNGNGTHPAGGRQVAGSSGRHGKRRVVFLAVPQAGSRRQCGIPAGRRQAGGRIWQAESASRTQAAAGRQICIPGMQRKRPAGNGRQCNGGRQWQQKQ